MGDGRAEGSSAIGDGGQAAVSLMPDLDGPGFGSLQDSLLEKYDPVMSRGLVPDKTERPARAQTYPHARSRWRI